MSSLSVLNQFVHNWKLSLYVCLSALRKKTSSSCFSLKLCGPEKAHTEKKWMGIFFFRYSFFFCKAKQNKFHSTLTSCWLARCFFGCIIYIQFFLFCVFMLAAVGEFIPHSLSHPPTFSHLTPIIISEGRRALMIGREGDWAEPEKFCCCCWGSMEFLKHSIALCAEDGEGKSFSVSVFFFSAFSSHIRHIRCLRFFLETFAIGSAVWAFFLSFETQRRSRQSRSSRKKRMKTSDERGWRRGKKINKSVPHERRAHKKRKRRREAGVKIFWVFPLISKREKKHFFTSINSPSHLKETSEKWFNLQVIVILHLFVKVHYIDFV